MIGAAVAGVALLALLAGSSGQRPAARRPSGRNPSSLAMGRYKSLMATMASLQIPRAVRTFLIATMWTESRFNQYAFNGVIVPVGAPPEVEPSGASLATRTKEADAASRAYDRNAERYAKCGFPKSWYAAGSYGLAQVLPANAMAAWWGTDRECVSPFFLWTEIGNIVASYAMLARLQNWKGWDGDVVTARMGWRSPELMKTRSPAAVARARSRLAEAKSAFGLSYSAIPDINHSNSFFAKMADI
jgi:hypothetical protein